jgi:hypothetical protein
VYFTPLALFVALIVLSSLKLGEKEKRTLIPYALES